MTTMSPMHEYMTGFAAWENPWPFEDSVATTTRTRREAPPEEMIMLEAIENTTATWHKVCAFDDLDIGAGTCVLAGGQQVAIFRIAGEIVRAVQNQCPHRGAAAMHQGLVGERGGQAAVFCPLHKRAYSLENGKCLDEEGASLRSYQVRVVAGMVEVLA
jgi:nitrite reductase (NADH) small subunit